MVFHEVALMEFEDLRLADSSTDLSLQKVTWNTTSRATELTGKEGV
jgi:hypothetical protein